MKTLRKKVAVITGAGSGIGKALAIQLARAGCHLALNDIHSSELEETARQIRKTGQPVSIHLANIADRDQVGQLSRDIGCKHNRVDLLINNAGISMVRKPVHEIDFEHWEVIFNVNFWGTLHCIRAFFPLLAKQEEGHIVNISSINGLVSASLRAPYCASKFAVRGLTEALIQESMGQKVRVTSVMPGMVATKIALHSNGWSDASERFANYAFQQNAAPTTAEKAARRIVRGIRKNRKRILIGPDAVMLDFLYRLFPILTLRLNHHIVTHGERKMIARTKSARKNDLALGV